MYTCNYADGMYLCGDYNARVGRGSDIINDVDDLPDRKIIDNVKNSHGDVLLEFLRDTQNCILNGRLTADFDNYTSLSTRGKSVVDYIITPYDCFTCCKSLKVDLLNDIIDSYKLTELIGERCRPPDHSVLTLTFTSHLLSGTHTDDRNVVLKVVYDDSDCDSYQGQPTKKRYLFKNVPSQFFNNELWRQALLHMIEKIECCHGTRTALDHLYEDVCQTISSEMDKYFNVKNNNVTRTRRKIKISKPFWNDELTCLWKDLRRHQNIFTNCTGNSNLKTNLRKKYQSAQKLLDKKIRQYERKYQQNQILEIERLNKHNPNEFWQHIKSLDPRKQNIIPIKVNTEEGVVDTTDEVLNEWQREFSNLYNHE